MNNALRAFDALSHETRLEALRLLIAAGPEGLPAGEVGERLDVRQNTMSVNLKILAEAGLIRSARDGRVVRYAADFDNVKGLLRFLTDDCCGGRPELCGMAVDVDACAC